MYIYITTFKQNEEEVKRRHTARTRRKNIKEWDCWLSLYICILLCLLTEEKAMMITSCLKQNRVPRCLSLSLLQSSPFEMKTGWHRCFSSHFLFHELCEWYVHSAQCTHHSLKHIHNSAHTKKKEAKKKKWGKVYVFFQIFLYTKDVHMTWEYIP